jgi:hypothetical protein
VCVCVRVCGCGWVWMRVYVAINVNIVVTYFKIDTVEINTKLCLARINLSVFTFSLLIEQSIQARY